MEWKLTGDRNQKSFLKRPKTAKEFESYSDTQKIGQQNRVGLLVTSCQWFFMAPHRQKDLWHFPQRLMDIHYYYYRE